MPLTRPADISEMQVGASGALTVFVVVVVVPCTPVTVVVVVVVGIPATALDGVAAWRTAHSARGVGWPY